MAGNATLIVRNGRIFTVDRGRPWAQAIAVEQDMIVRVGTNEEVEKTSGSETKILDAGGRLVLPGFNDSHIHTSMAYEEAYSAQLGDAKSMEEISAAVRKHAEAHPEYRLVGGTGWKHEAALTDQRYPRKEEMDRIISDRPLLIVSYDGWVGLGNSKFTEMAVNAFKGRPDHLGGMERDPDTDEAAGVFHNPGDLTFLAGDLSDLIRESEFDGLRWIFSQLPKYGITSVHDAQSDFRSFDAYERLRREGGLLSRVYIAFGHTRQTTDADLEQIEDIKANHSDEWLRAGAVKLFIDGVLDSHTAAMLEPYADDPSTSGDTKYSPDEFKSIVEKLDRMGFQCMTHACGDRGVRTALDAYEFAAERNGRRDSRHRIEHIEMLSQEDVPRFKRLGVIASMQPMHAAPITDSVYVRAAGQERMRSSFPWRALDEAGAVLAFSSDWSVADLNPLPEIQAAVTRNWSDDSQRTVTLEKAIEAYTLNGAYAAFEEDVKGSIQEGKLADFVILSDNLFDMEPDEIGGAEVLLTVVGGKVVYRSDRFDG
ncbi:MAG: amidohydrolase [Methanobacteriota archaeon]|nr:MAG: amidohydrolase [Euryarchaeota archaeon]